MATTLSGSSNLPGILSYPQILLISEVPEIKGQYAYIIRGYPEKGFVVVIKRFMKDDTVNVQIGDFDGQNLIHGNMLDGLATEFMKNNAPTLIGMMKCLGIEQAIFYMAVTDNGPVLVDVRLSLDKFCGPGMVRDLFSKVLKTQEIIKIAPLDEPLLEAIINGAGEYTGSIILKCSVFKTITRDTSLLPLYTRIR